MIDQSLSDESLVERVKERDHQAFSLLVERHHIMFYKTAYRIVLNVVDAEDVVQESFLKLQVGFIRLLLMLPLIKGVNLLVHML